MKTQRLVAGSLLLGLVVACGKKKDDDDDTPAAPADTQTVATGAGGSTTTTTTTTSSSVNALLSAYPSGLALSVFPTEVAAALRLMGADDAAEEQLAEDSKPLEEKKKEGEDLINGKGASCLSPALKSVREVLDSEETCYQFDEDMLYSGSAPHVDDSDRPSEAADLKWGGTVDGLSSLTGEACLVSFARSKISQVTSLVDVATGMVQTMMCQAKKADAAVALPALGGTLDLKAALSAAMGDKADKIDEARIIRLDDVDERPVYDTKIVMALPNGGTRTVRIIHSPNDATGEYNGTLYNIVETPDDAAEDLPWANKDRAMSIVYARVADGDEFRLVYELRSLNVPKTLTASVIGADGVVDYNVGADFSGELGEQGYGDFVDPDTGDAFDHQDSPSAMTFIAFNILESSSEGTLSYWQNPGPSYSEAARGMTAYVEKADDTYKGCATSGAALGDSPNPFEDSLSIRKAVKEGLTLKPEGFFHPFYNAREGGGPQACTNLADALTDATGTYYIKDCDFANPGTDYDKSYRKWYAPLVADTALADTFATAATGNIISRQCYVLQDGLYVIDTDTIDEANGYELVDMTSDDAEDVVVGPPDVSDVTAFDGDVVKADE
jgi:hypothetical protein